PVLHPVAAALRAEGLEPASKGRELLPVEGLVVLAGAVEQRASGGDSLQSVLKDGTQGISIALKNYSQRCAHPEIRMWSIQPSSHAYRISDQFLKNLQTALDWHESAL